MKGRLSASVMAGVCTVCIAASSGTVMPHAVAAAPTATSIATVSPRYTLAAASTSITAANQAVLLDLLNIAGLPLQNLTTAINSASALTGILFLPNTIYTLTVTGKSDQIPQAVQDAIAKEQAAFQAFFKLPQSIIATDVAAFQKLFADLGTGGTAVATPSSKVAVVTPRASATAAPQQVFADLLNVLGLPLQNLTTTINAASALTGILFLPNTIYTLTVTGKSDQIPKAIQDAIATEKAAFQTFVKLPKTIIATDVAAVQKLFADFGPATATSTAVKSTKVDRLALNAGASTTSAGEADETTPAATPPKTRHLPVRHLLEKRTAATDSATKDAKTDAKSDAKTASTDPTATSTDAKPSATAGTGSDTSGGYVGRHRLKLGHPRGANGASSGADAGSSSSAAGAEK